MTGVEFERCKMLAVDIASLGVAPLAVEPIRFEACRLDFANFTGVELPGATWRECSLREADFARAVLTGTVFDGCDLSGARFVETDRSTHMPERTRAWPGPAKNAWRTSSARG